MEARLAKLRIAAEEREYADLVQDVSKKQRGEEERVPFATYKDQLGLGELSEEMTSWSGTASLSSMFRLRTPSRDWEAASVAVSGNLRPSLNRRSICL